MNEKFYRSKLWSAVLKAEEEIRLIESGDISRVCCNMSGEYDGGGKFDVNYENRLIIARYLMWSDERLPDTEKLTAFLLKEEISAKKQDAYQGIGDCLGILSVILDSCNADGKYDELFSQAKNANFDCECGYSIETFKNEYAYSFSEITPYECICLLSDIDCSAAAVLAEKYAEEHLPKTARDYTNLIYINKMTGREKENIPYYEAVAEITLEHDDPWKCSSALGELIGGYIKNGEFEKAYRSLGRAREYIFRVKEWYSCGLGRDYFEYAAELILHMPERAESLWDEWKYFAVNAADDICINCLKKLITAAESVHDNEAVNIFNTALSKKEQLLRKSKEDIKK